MSDPLQSPPPMAYCLNTVRSGPLKAVIHQCKRAWTTSNRKSLTTTKSPLDKLCTLIFFFFFFMARPA